MDPDSVKSTLSNLAFGNVLAAATRDYQKELMANDKAQSSSSVNQILSWKSCMLTELQLLRIMVKHLKSLAPRHFNIKFVKLDAENATFFVTKLGIKTLPCVILFRNGVATDRLIGFQDLGAKDDFPTRTLEFLLLKKRIIGEKKQGEDADDDYLENKQKTVRSSINSDSE